MGLFDFLKSGNSFSKMTEKQKEKEREIAFVSCLVDMSLSDGKIDPQESEILSDIAMTLNVTNTEVKDYFDRTSKDKNHAKNVLSSLEYKDKKALIIKLWEISYLDGETDTTESNKISSLINYMGIGMDEFKQIMLDHSESLKRESEHEKSSTTDLEKFNNEVFKLYESIENQMEKKGEDVPYWYKVINERVVAETNMISSFPSENEKSIEERIGTNIWAHCEEYHDRLEGDGDMYNGGKTYDSIDEKTEFIKMRIIGFGHVYMLIQNLPVHLYKIAEKYNVDSSEEKEKATNKFIHSKSSLYGCIKYALRIGISNETIKTWYKDFEYDKKLIEGINSFELTIKKHSSDDDIQEKDKVSQVTAEVSDNLTVSELEKNINNIIDKNAIKGPISNSYIVSSDNDNILITHNFEMKIPGTEEAMEVLGFNNKAEHKIKIPMKDIIYIYFKHRKEEDDLVIETKPNKIFTNKYRGDDPGNYSSKFSFNLYKKLNEIKIGFTKGNNLISSFHNLIYKNCKEGNSLIP